MKIKVIFVLITLMVEGLIFAQNNDEYSIKFGGYVNYSLIYDSRQVVALRENHFTIYPKAKMIKNGEDLNAIDNLQATAILTRVNMKVTGGKFLGAKTTGFLETEFMGNSENDVNGLRIRHAYVNLTWGNLSLLLGQYWNPMFIVENFPDVIGANGGAPFQPFARNPQIRLTYEFNGLKFSSILGAQRDFTSLGPKGATNEYLRNSKIPLIGFSILKSFDNNLIGIAGEYKSLIPEPVSSANYKSKNRVNSFAGLVHGKLNFNDLTIKGEVIYGSNLSDYVMMGGYAVKNEDPVTKIKEYTPLRYLTYWLDVYYGKDLQFGLFIGRTKNMGSSDEIKGEYYARGADIDNLLRIAPRISYKEGNVKFALEYEYTEAAYGKNDKNGKVFDLTNVANNRVMFGAYYFINY